MNLGKNIREGAHYTQFMVYDLDGDGKAELVCKTAVGTIDGVGKVIGDVNADHRQQSPETSKPTQAGETSGTTERSSRPDPRGRFGYILQGPEYLTVFNGLTGLSYWADDQYGVDAKHAERIV